ncbi:PepSY-associated TM helix domain-containing protein [Pulveribacter sp.]|uniref:PepSY-associated TM helix domain-containing protein n=1 Tax=Pulveribacter sp. TaxID=2678893 RepID=UPI0028AA8F6D|nr:PepSY-associated TM helix domain-containing protein [Pulveribacter sp.]
MKAATLRNYLSVHTWTGILAGMLLFVAFYAGALAMFTPEISHWSRAEPARAGASQDADALLAAFFAAHPGQERATLVLASEHNAAPYVRWGVRGQPPHLAELDAARSTLRPLAATGEEAGRFVDYLHRKGGLPLPLEPSEPVIGIVSMLYALALVSGVIALLPSLVKDLFIVRFASGVKRRWLDLHNLLGIASLPFHVVMALSAAVFCLHDWIYVAQDHLIYPQGLRAVETRAQPARTPVPLERAAWRPPTQLIADAARSAPGFAATALDYRGLGTPRAAVYIAGSDDTRFKRRPREGFAVLDPATGALVADGMVPGQGSGMARAVVTFFALHFGSYGSEPVRVLYAVLGVMGALLFYTGNVLWIETRSKRLRGAQAGAVQQPRHVRWIAALNLGVCVGCVAGLSLALVAARWLATTTLALDWVLHGVYYTTCAVCLAWAFARGAQRAAAGLLGAAALATALIPLTSAAAALLGNPKPYTHGLGLVDALSAAGAALLTWMAWRAARRPASATAPPRPSVSFPTSST